jgi:hypothetical protein
VNRRARFIAATVWITHIDTADYADEQNHPAIRRGRFTVPIADLSALGGCFGIRINLLIPIIAPSADLSAIIGINLSDLTMSS